MLGEREGKCVYYIGRCRQLGVGCDSKLLAVCGFSRTVDCFGGFGYGRIYIYNLFFLVSKFGSVYARVGVWRQSFLFYIILNAHTISANFLKF